MKKQLKIIVLEKQSTIEFFVLILYYKVLLKMLINNV